MAPPNKSRAVTRSSEEPKSPDLSEESKKIINAINLKLDEKLDQIRVEFRAALAEKNAEIAALKTHFSSLQTRVEKLEEAIDDGDAYERRDTLLFSGDGVPAVSTDEIPASVVCSLVKEKLRLNLNPTDISTAHRMGRKPNTQATDRRKLVVKLCRRDLKRDILMAAKNIKPDFYVNESLTPLRSKILFALRKIRRSHPHILKGSSSIEGRVFAWIASDPGRADSPYARILVNSLSKLSSFCEENLNLPLSNFIDQ